MGRNIFQRAAPRAMLRAVSGVVHDGLVPADALELYETLAIQTPGARHNGSRSPSPAAGMTAS